MDQKSLEEIISGIKRLQLSSKFDLVVGICNGGIVPAYLFHSLLKIPLEFVRINFRDEIHKPKTAKPVLLRPLNFDAKGKRTLLVDDRCNSGATFALAKETLKNAESINTFVINGKADYSLFNEDCIDMPWDVSE